MLESLDPARSLFGSLGLISIKVGALSGRMKSDPMLQHELAHQQLKQSKGAGHHHQQDEYDSDDQPSN
jgi:hypothetical protein